MKQNKKTGKEELTSNDYVNVKNIIGDTLYTKNGYIMCYLRIYNFNTALFSREECKARTETLVAMLKNDRGTFQYMTYPREADLDDYKKDLKERIQSEDTEIGVREILRGLYREANELSTSGENFEHQHFIKLWRKIEGNDLKRLEHDLMQRRGDFIEAYAAVGIRVEALKEQEIIKLCNLFGNSFISPYEITHYDMYEEISVIG